MRWFAASLSGMSRTLWRVRLWHNIIGFNTVVVVSTTKLLQCWWRIGISDISKTTAHACCKLYNVLHIYKYGTDTIPKIDQTPWLEKSIIKNPRRVTSLLSTPTIFASLPNRSYRRWSLVLRRCRNKAFTTSMTVFLKARLWPRVGTDACGIHRDIATHKGWYSLRVARSTAVYYVWKKLGHHVMAAERT